MTRNTFYRLALPFAAALAMTACGGGGGSGGGGVFLPPVAGTPPATTPAQDGRTDAFVAYVKDLVSRFIDTAEPADVTAFDPPPTSDTREPVATQ